MSYQFKEHEISVLKNFSQINNSLIIDNYRLSVQNPGRSIIAEYLFEEKYDFEKFGLYNASEFINAYLSIDDASFKKVADKYLEIYNNESVIKYYTTPLNLIQEVPDNVSNHSNIKNIKWNVEVKITADKFAILNKMINIIKANFIYFLNVNNTLNLILTNELNSSNNSYAIKLTDVNNNTLGDKILRFDTEDIIKLYKNVDYVVNLSTNKISQWHSMNGIKYFIGCSII